MKLSDRDQSENGQLAATELAPAMAPALECKGLSKRFGGVVAVAGLDLSIPQGQVLALLGPSGCGKTTALRLIAGFEEPDDGVITIGGQTVSGAGENTPRNTAASAWFSKKAHYSPI